MLGDPPKSRGNPGPIIPPVKGLKEPNWEIPSVTAAAAAAADDEEPKGEAAAAADEDAEEEEEEEEAAEVLADEAAEELEDPAEAPLFNMFRQFSSVLNIRQRDRRSSESAKTDPKSRDRNTQGLMMSPQRSTWKQYTVLVSYLSTALEFLKDINNSEFWANSVKCKITFSPTF